MFKRATIVGAACIAVLQGVSIASDPDTETPSLLDAAAAPYVNLRADIANIETAGITKAQAMRDAHNLLASHDADKLTEGYVAYAALVAADVEAFHNAIEQKTKRRRDRERFVEELTLNPAMVRDIPGAEQAIAAIMDMTARDATRIADLGQLYIDNAYELQQQAWARKKLPANGMARVNGAAKWAEARPWPAMAPRTAIRSKAGNFRPNLDAQEDWSVTWSTAGTPPTPDSKSGRLMSQILVLAAHYTVGDLEESHMREYAHAKPTNRCFINSKLNFNQCIAATRTPYEEAFCIGTHGLKDVSRCVGWPASAGATR